ncbi:hypothetical protein O181_001847 [Austropuccinia psidii MF-1]|uniref:Uncharacterized protein n=1 Tax=Austropuccinia psidii MF-1 TaxID=1389203 RepID=A0A9Q3GDG5_9BASI|nr:hypothetical protein [Austropuccinia psidii MF-1]
MNQIQSVKKDFKSKLEVAINRFKTYADKSRENPPVFNHGHMVWLSSKNIKSTRPTKKLSERWLCPFAILKMSVLMLTTSSLLTNGNPPTQSSTFLSLNQSGHQQSKIGIKSLLLQSSLKKRSGKSFKDWTQISREKNSGIWWNGKFSLKTQKDSLGNQPQTSRIAMNFSRIFILYILRSQDPILQELDFSYGSWWGEELPKVSPTPRMNL